MSTAKMARSIADHHREYRRKLVQELHALMEMAPHCPKTEENLRAAVEEQHRFVELFDGIADEEEGAA